MVRHGLSTDGRLASTCLEPSPAIWKWSKFAPLSGDYFSLYLLFVTADTALVQYYQEYHCPLRQAQYTIRFHLIHVSFGTHRCYRHLGEWFPGPLVRLIQCQVHFMPWSVLCSSAGALVVFLVPVLPPVVKDLDVVTVRSTYTCGVAVLVLPRSCPRSH